MEFAVNELGQPVIYIVNYVYVEHNVRQASFQTATVTLAEAEGVVGNRTCFEIIEQNMATREQCPVSLIQKQEVEKYLLLGLYKSGDKRQIFEELDVRKPFQEQLKFPIAPELEKAKKKASAAASI
jgi:hypothetical protein